MGEQAAKLAELTESLQQARARVSSLEEEAMLKGQQINKVKAKTNNTLLLSLYLQLLSSTAALT